MKEEENHMYKNHTPRSDYAKPPPFNVMRCRKKREREEREFLVCFLSPPSLLGIKEGEEGHNARRRKGRKEWEVGEQ